MALVLYDRVQETTATTGTGTITLAGAVSGYQSFAVVGNGNTTFYCIVNGSAWEVGIGTYSSTGPTLARTTVLSNSNGNTSPITLSGSSNVFVTYPSEKSVNLDASGNVSALGTIASGTWQGTTVAVGYGGTGVTTSSGANSVVLRDANVNVSANNFLAGYNVITAAAGTTVLTTASAYYQRISGSTTQTIQLPDATTMVNGQGFTFDNDSSGAVSIVDNASGAIDTVPSGGYSYIFVESNATSAGSWGKYALIPASYDFSTTIANFGTAIITNTTYQGNAVGTAYGGTGLTGFSAANNAIYSTSSSALTAGTLPVAAGGTGLSTVGTSGYFLQSNGTSLQYAAVPATTPGGSNTYVQYNNSGSFGGSSNLVFDGTNLTVGGNISTGGYLKYTATTTAPTGASIFAPAANTLAFSPNGAEAMRITSLGGVSFGSSGTAYGSSGQVLQSNGNAAPTWTSNISGNAANITASSNTTLTSLANLATVGTITSGTWNGSSISTTYTAAKVTDIQAGTGISVNATTGSVTITNTGSYAGPNGQLFTSTGTFTIPSGRTQVKVTVVGAGGGGGSDNGTAGSGGGAGGTVISWLTGLTPGNTISISAMGTGGSGVTSGTGGTGGTTTVSSGSQSISTLSATGGQGGVTGGGSGGTGGGQPGSGSGGTFNLTGGAGGKSGNGCPGVGGSTLFGGNGGGISPGARPGTQGGGGGGAQGSSYSGGNGGNGLVLFEW